MNAPPEPPPPVHERKPRRRLQFNTATLLGVMALVAVACTLAITVPGLLTLLAGLLASAVVVAYAAFLVAGVLSTEGDRRVFPIAAASSLVVSMWGGPSASFAPYFMEPSSLSPVLLGFIWSGLAPLQHISLSLFGGWVAVRAVQYWAPAAAGHPRENRPRPPAESGD